MSLLTEDPLVPIGTTARRVALWASDTVTYAYHASVPGLRTGLTLQQPSGSWSQTYDHIGQLRTAVGTGGQSTENLDGQERTSANTPTVS